MVFEDVKAKLISLFDYEKLDGRMDTEREFVLRLALDACSKL
jgi:hypothetical protein